MLLNFPPSFVYICAILDKIRSTGIQLLANAQYLRVDKKNCNVKKNMLLVMLVKKQVMIESEQQ